MENAISLMATMRLMPSTQYNMKTLEFWAPIIFSIPLTIVCGIIVMGSAGVGHGSGLPLIILFPYVHALWHLADKSKIPGLGLLAILALLQFPLYGLVLAIARSKGRSIRAATILVGLHLLLAGYGLHSSYGSLDEIHAAVIDAIGVTWPELGSKDKPLRIDMEKLETLRVPYPPKLHKFYGNTYYYLSGVRNCSKRPTGVDYYPQDHVFFLFDQCESGGEGVGPFRGDPRKVLPQVTVPLTNNADQK